MDWLIVALVMMGMIPGGIFLGFVMGDPIWRCKILNKVTRGFYGVVVLEGWGNNALLLTKNLKKDLINIGEDVYAVQDRMILNLKKPSLSELKLFEKHPEALLIKERAKVVKTITDSDIRVIGGVPFIEFHKDSMIPIDKAPLKLEDKYKNMLPGRVGATLKTEVAIARAKAYNEQGEKMLKLMYIIAIIGVVSAGIGIFIYWNMGQQTAMIQTIYNRTADIIANQMAINQSVIQ